MWGRYGSVMMFGERIADCTHGLRSHPPPHLRSTVAVQNPLYETAQSALDKSCYRSIDWKISEDKPGP